MKNLPCLFLLFVLLPIFSNAQDTLATEIQQFFDKLVGTWEMGPDGPEKNETNKDIFPTAAKLLESTLEIKRWGEGIGIEILSDGKADFDGKLMDRKAQFVIACACITASKTIFGMMHMDGVIGELQGTFENGKLYSTVIPIGLFPRGNVLISMYLSEDNQTFTYHQRYTLHEVLATEILVHFKRVKKD